MLRKGCLTIFIMAVLAVISVSQSLAAYVTDIRSYSEANKTRIVVALDAPAQYQAHYTSEPGISMCLLKTGLRSDRKTINVDGELVRTVALKEVMGNIVEVSISLMSGAAFTIFPLESPDRIVIDVVADAAMEAIQPLALSKDIPEEEPESPPETLIQTAVTNESKEISITENPVAASVKSETSAKSSSDAASIFSLSNMDYTLAQLCFNALFVIALVIMGIKLWFVSRASRKNRDALRENVDFSNIMSKLELGMEEKSKVLEQQPPLPVKSDNSDKLQKKRRRKEKTPQLSAQQKQYEEVHKLAQLGMDRMQISQQSKIPIGEVNLILDLSKARSQMKAN